MADPVEIVRTELRTPTLGHVYSVMTPQAVADAINTANQTEIVDVYVTELAIIDAFSTSDAGETFVQKLEAVTSPKVKRAVKWIGPTASGRSPSGLNVGNPKVRNGLDGLVGVEGIVQSEIDTVKNLAVNTISGARKLGLPGECGIGWVILARR